MARIVIRDSVPAYTRRPFFYMPMPLRSDEYAASSRAAVEAGKFLVAMLTSRNGEAEYVSALEADGPDKVEPYYERAITREELRQMLHDFGSVPNILDVELRVQPQNEAYVLGLIGLSKNFNLVQTESRNPS